MAEPLAKEGPPGTHDGAFAETNLVEFPKRPNASEQCLAYSYNRSEERFGGSERLRAGLEDCQVDAEPLSRVLTGLVPVIHADPTSTDAGRGSKAACLGGVGGRDKPGQDDL